MTKQEILDALDLLRDLTGHEGKPLVDSIKEGVNMNLLDRDDAIEPAAEEPEVEHSKKPVATKKRRSK